MKKNVTNQPCCQDVSDRRSFHARLSMILSAIIGALIVLPGVGFVLAPIFKKTNQKWRMLGKVDDFKEGATVLVNFEDPSSEVWAGVTAKTAAWLRRVDESEFIAFSINCRHLGCPVRWVEGPELFMCPCHGGVYYKDGTVAGGPPPEPLDRYQVRVRDGAVEIHTAAVPLTTTLTFDES
ncbi:QcrA and Rieske domain-containing protein [Bythopirellula polymerisocia]|uniref:Cytochrome b6-f complex iron-sulfur subunit n=1 Tax=Bythopirellula polymerisocia TaxID=2528003 RepID=A0A5C6CWY4_9BACT|nr:ubiquinol-cytochrome c reductase iron-sulfur subunit [Bythopirellula polymerisocia]TWU28077.1 Cytochrome b6-f complex iron-sulfur subunit [Bythopirellula polymerisocia]